MLVHVLHHGHCFDGVASAALFSAFYRGHVDASARFAFIPKLHAPGDPFETADFEADVVACVDFRYSTDPRLTWWFDHHRSAFQLPGQREHYEADRSGKKFYDPRATSCTGFIAQITGERFGFDASGHEQLLHWAERIDSASFDDAHAAVQLTEPALQLMTFAEHNGHQERIPQLVEDLLTRPFEQIVQAPYIRSVVEPILERHRLDIELIAERCELHDGVLEYDLLDQPPRIYNKFIAYHHHPEVRYVVGASIGPDGKPKLTAGYNPWLPNESREHNLADLCESFGGGGHPFVGGVSFEGRAEATAREAMRSIAATLRSAPEPGTG